MTATLGHPSSEETTVTVSAAAVPPAIAADFTLNGTTLTIAAGATESTGSVTITAVDNNVDAPHKTVTVSASAVNSQGVTAPSSVTLAINDDEAAPTVTLHLTPDSIAENGGSSAVTATLDHPSSVATTVTVTVTAVSPAVAGDFTLSQNKILMIAAGATESTGSVTITAVDNSTVEPDKTVTVTAAANNSVGVTAPSNVALIITDNDRAPTVTLILTPDSIVENGGSSAVTATVSPASSAPFTVTVTVSAVSPAVAGDFTLSQNTTLSFAANSTTSTGSVSVTANDNDVHALDKAVTVTGSVTGGTNVIPPPAATLAIAEDEAPPAVMLHLTPDSIAENGGSSTVMATVSPASSAPFTVTVSVSAVSPAVAGDFTLSPNTTLSFAANSTTSTGSVSITANDNDVHALDKAVTVTGSVTGGTNVTPPPETTLVIAEDEVPPAVTLILTPDSIAENGGTSMVKATLDHPSSEETTVSVSASAVLPAVAADFTLNGTTLTIAAGATDSTEEVTITAADNNVDAPDKMVTVSAVAVNSQGVESPSNAALTIIDDDRAPSVTLILTLDSIAENGGSSTVKATLDHPSSEETAVTVSAAAVSPAVARDFTLSQNKILMIAAGAMESTGEVTITAIDNNVDAPDKTVTVSASAVNSQGVTAPSSATLVINDDEAAPTVTLHLSPDSIAENGGSSAVTATLDHPSSVATTVTVTVTAVSPAVAGDFTLSQNKILMIAAGATDSTGTVTITAVDNSAAGPDKTMTVSADANNSMGVTAPLDVALIITDNDRAPAVTLILTPDSIAENGGSSAVTATASPVSSAPFTVTVTVTAVSPAVAGDFTLSQNTTLSFAANATTSTGSVSVTANDNDVHALDKAVTVTGSVTGGTNVTPPSATTLVIAEDEAPPAVTLILTPDSIAENGGSSTVTATLDHPSSEETTVSVSAAAVLPAVAGDFMLSANKTLTIAANSTTSAGTVTVRAVNNNVDAPDKTVTVSAVAVNSQGVENPSNAALTIIDDDGAPAVTLHLTPSSIAENGGSSAVTATLDHPSSEETAVTVSAAAVLPAVATDFTLNGTTLTIAAGATDSTGSVTITAADNNVDAPDKTVTVSASAVNSQGVTAPSSATLAINDDEAAPTVTLHLSPDSIAENGGSSAVTATLDHPSSEETTVTVSAAAVSPAVVGDFTLSQNKILMIAAGATDSTGTVTITAVDNSAAGSDKTVTVLAAANNSVGVTAPSSVTLAINDDEGAPAVTLILTPDSIAENGGSSAVTATVSPVSSAPFTVTVSASAVLPAVAEDFTLSQNTTLSFAANATTSTGSVSVTANDNDVYALDKAVTVTGSVTGGTNVIPPPAATLAIAEDEAPPAVTLILTPDSITENGGSSTVTATVSPASSAPFTVTVSAAPDANAAAEDFTLSSNTTLSFAANATDSTGSVTITAADNNVDAPDKTVSVSAVAVNSQGVENPSNAALTIIDDEVAPAVTLILTPDSIAENGGSSTVTASLDHPSSEETTVTVSAAAVSPAIAADFTLNGTALTIAAGATDSTGSVTITAVDNNVDAPDKTVTVSASAVNSQGVTAPSSATLAINDDEAAPTVTLHLSPDSIAENGGSSAVTATLDHPSSEETTVTVSAAAVSPAVAADFTLSQNKILMIAAGATDSTGTVTITAVDNSAAGSDKTVTVSAAANNSVGVTAPSSVTLAINDDEGAPAVTLILTPSSIAENGGSSAVTATVSPVSSAPFTVTVTVSAVLPAVARDFTLSQNTTLSFAANATTSTGSVSVTANDNDVHALDKAVTVTGSVTGGTNVIPPPAATLAIAEDEAPPAVTLILTPDSIAEDGGSSTVTATLDHPSSEETTVTVSAAAVLPAVAGDFMLSANKTLTIAANSTTSAGTVTVRAVNNNVDAPDKTVTVSAVAVNSQGVENPSNAALTIIDDDGAPAVTLHLTPSSIAEDGGSSAVTATLDHPSSEETTVTVSAAAVLPAVATDFTLNGTTLMIAAGATDSTGSVTITAADNNVDAPDKTVTVSASAVNSQGVTAPSSATLAINDDEAAPTVTLHLSSDSIAEDGGSSAVTATLDHPSSEETTVTVSAAAVSPAVVGDFTLSQNKILMIAAGATDSTGTVTITAVDNSAAGSDKTVTVSAAANNSVGVTAPSSVTLAINDDEGAPAVTLILTPSSIAENGGSSAVTATASPVSSAPFTVTVSVSAVLPAVARDFTLSQNTTLSFAANSTTSTGSVLVTANDNDVHALDKAVTVTGSVTGGTNVIPPPAATLAIAEDEAPPAVTLILTPDSIAENGGSSTVTATLDHPSSEETTVTVSAAAVLPAVAGDFMLSANKTLTIVANSTTSAGTVTVRTVNNNVDAPDKTVTVSAVAVNSQGVENPSNAALTIIDDDGAPAVTLHLTPSSIAENGGSSAVTATLDHPSSEETTVTVSAAAVHPAVATDFTLNGTTLTIAAGATDSTGEVTITAIDNNVDAPDKTVTVSAATVDNAVGVTAPPTATLIITDDDQKSTDIVLRVSPTNVAEEGGSQIVMVTAKYGSTVTILTDTAIAVEVTGNTASAADDFSPVAEFTVVIDAGELSGEERFTLTPVADLAVEGDETLTVSGSASGYSVQPAELTIIDDAADAGIERMNRLSDVSDNILPQVARTIVADTVVAVSGRIGAVMSGSGLTATYSLETLRSLAVAQADSEQTEADDAALKQLLDGATFTLPLNAADNGQAADGSQTIWGGGEFRNLSSEGEVEWEGEMSSITLGTDRRLESGILAGVAAIWSKGAFDYRQQSRGEGAYRIRMTSAYPYWGWSTQDGLNLWATLGYGKGEIQIDERGEALESSDALMKAAAAGISSELLSTEGPAPGGAVTLRLKGEAFLTKVSVKGNGGAIDSTASNAGRLRFTLEGSQDYALASGARLTPSAELGVRHDWGGGLEGSGLEVGAAFLYVDSDIGMALEGRARGLVAYRAQDERQEYREWGVSGSMRLLPKAYGLGMSFGLNLSHGAASSGIENLWSRLDTARTTSGGKSTSRIDTELGYGLSAPGMQGVLTPFAGVALDDGTRTYRLGGRMRFDAPFGLSLKVEGEHRESGGADAEQSLMLRGSMRW